MTRPRKTAANKIDQDETIDTINPATDCTINSALFPKLKVKFN